MARTRRRKRPKTASSTLPQSAWQAVTNRIEPVRLLEEDDLDQIHNASMDVLETVGLEVLSQRAVDLFASAGADIDYATNRVRLDRSLVAESVAKAPSSFVLHARNPERNLKIGDRQLVFCPATTPPNVTDIDRGRRPGNYRHYCDLLRLSQSLNIVHCLTGYPVEPQDLPPLTRHLDSYDAFIRLTDKVWRPYSLAPGGISDALDMICIARGINLQQLSQEPSLISNVNLNSPLKFDDIMADGLIEMSEMGQAVVVSAFTLAGAMAPASLEGALVQQNAEVLAGVALTQIVRPGAPVVYGSFTSNVDMKTGSPAFGTPEYLRAAIASGQLARRYALPYRTSNTNSANAVDAQAIYESQMSIWGAVMGGANILFHSFGWLESGLTNSLEKFVIDAEMLQMVAETFRPFDTSPDNLALNVIQEIGPGGHFFGTQHTLDRYRNAFHEPMLSDWRNFESWSEAGKPDAVQQANRVWKKLLEDYQPPPLDDAICEELAAYVAKRKAQPAASATT